jgi:hypothetical protein
VGLVQYLRNAADVSPEGLTFVDAVESPLGRDALFVTNEVSGTVSLFASRLVGKPRPGDLLFVAANSDGPDAFAFMLARPFEAGAQIGFSDRDYSAASGFPSSGESVLMWTADRAYEAGTIVTVQTEVSSNVASADKGLLIGRGGDLSTSGETIYAFSESVAALDSSAPGAISVDQLLASLNIGGGAAGDVPSPIAPYSQSFGQDNVKYNGPLDAAGPVALALLIDNPANWLTSDTVVYSLAGGSLFPV